VTPEEVKYLCELERRLWRHSVLVDGSHPDAQVTWLRLQAEASALRQILRENYPEEYEFHVKQRKSQS
jgi:hypothetical protein